ncbi:autoinducer binding domain-containing protein [Roseisalinus antarcticus]|uniref:Autoinducer binding domain protein n=1 Tax=Roseisalinus antarcticus TaxID=254357 RepID=A0A1Y5TTB9_9RHOB|nr:autoinducer binding domain-containing protein [Roseisalinus antarcticus]SLN67794.1 Autoinducer binding domain protein [Roseisalinus antarcticus]
MQILEACKRDLTALAPKGYFFALHIRNASPLLQEKTFHGAWIRTYEREVYILRDPIVAWGYSHSGLTRWSAVDIPDPFDIFGQARAHGLAFGASAALGSMNSRSLVSIAHDRREFSDLEMGRFATIVRQLHDITSPPEALTLAQANALRRISEGERHAEAAAKLQISESALKARLKSARVALMARTTAEAVRRAQTYRLI